MVTLIRNLVSNAVKFSYEGGQVEVKAGEKDGQLLFSVSDQGIGIPSEDLPHLFEKFYRVRLAMESGIKGTGLGLALAKEAAEAHGGRIEVKSQVGVGSCFTAILPIAPPGQMPDEG
jgi:signal transduction histidine kinase